MIKETEWKEHDKAINEAVKREKESLGGGQEFIDITIVADEDNDNQFDPYVATFKLPRSQEYNKFQKMGVKGSIGDASILLVNTCLIYPKQDIFNEVVLKYPGFISQILEKLLATIGVTANATAKKR